TTPDHIHTLLLTDQMLYILHGLTRTGTFADICFHLQCSIAHKTVDDLRATTPADLRKITEWNHLVLIITYMPLCQIFGFGTKLCIALHNHPFNPATINKVINIVAAPGR